MAMPRVLGLICSIKGSRFNLTPFSFITPRFLSVDFLDGASSPIESNSTLSERFILEELSNLLPIDPDPPKPRLFVEKSVQESAFSSLRDRTLSHGEKLRGIFLQKLPGRSALESALSASGVDLTEEIFADVLNKGGLGGAAMISFFNWAIQQPNVTSCVETYNVMLKALGRRKFFEFVEEILLRMKEDGFGPNAETLEILMDNYISACQVSKAIKLFRNLKNIGGKHNLESLNIVLRCLSRRSHVKVASSLFNTMKGEFPFDNVTYNEIISGWAKFGRVDKVEGYCTMMVADGLLPDSVTFSYIIEALGRAGRIDDAVDIFEKMEDKGCLRDTRTFNAMITNFISIGDLDKCIKYYKDMTGKECSPNSDTYAKLISAFLKVRRVADALELFDEMLFRGILPSTGMITSIIEPLCSFGPPHAAMIIYKKSRKAGCKLSMKAYKLLLMRLSRLGKSGMVLKIWEEMQDSGYASDREVYKYIVNGLCNIGQVDNAVLVVEESLQKGFCLGRIIYSKLNGKLLEMNKVEIAYKLFLKIKNARLNANSRSYWRANGWHF
ncbi:hypothetical protein Cni_G27629 [Canna indica]|uniref:Pentatricopeptide repeat-containing protein n=1 Tax=Canna indica TaxID=4628 RepID=A0AAQ3L449_9LILI|nr:hypothetical protein Cni_G27629 [Canna indica]